jgi:hypothetical protein
MRESLMCGSVRGARGNSRPYRDVALLHLLTAAYGTHRRFIAANPTSAIRGTADL